MFRSVGVLFVCVITQPNPLDPVSQRKYHYNEKQKTCCLSVAAVFIWLLLLKLNFQFKTIFFGEASTEHCIIGVTTINFRIIVQSSHLLCNTNIK